jgi:antitoxin PrlF
MARAGDELVNPITCERIVFRKTAAETGGALLEMDDFWMRPGHRAPLEVRRALGIGPGSEVEFELELDEEGARLRVNADQAAAQISRIRGAGAGDMSTEETLALTRR